ncbi:hypothetical protein SO802_028672 [Lithocarpus litseifolius]|uniref:RNase H type-1 domain-containing protein n=1 Tax=Lithocarpus litseifolius TaxID=425828 RepID=A0AAW2BRX3_9ROSI
MEKIGFHSTWIGWISECIRSITYSVLVNGEPKGHIIPTRGIRQEDPLSLYLFLLCSKGLNGLIEHAVDRKHIESFSLCKNGPKIPHLFFAEDSLLFCLARLEDVRKILEILGKYEVALDQKINFDKTTLFFSKNVFDSSKELVKNLLGVPKIREYEKYLGLLVVVGRNKKASLNYIKDRVWGKLQEWKEKLLSQAGKEVLLKAVVQAIPTFAMSCFRLPVGLCRDIEMLIRKFWWGQRDGKSKRIFLDAWLSSPTPSVLAPEATVDTLINPQTGNMKTNYDGTMFGESDEAGIGVVIQNSDGEVMAALPEKIQKLSSVKVLELLAARRAVSFTSELGFINSTFEGDCESVV